MAPSGRHPRHTKHGRVHDSVPLKDVADGAEIRALLQEYLDEGGSGAHLTWAVVAPNDPAHNGGWYAGEGVSKILLYGHDDDPSAVTIASYDYYHRLAEQDA